MQPRASRRTNLGAKVRRGSCAAMVSRAGRSIGGEPIQVWPDDIWAFLGALDWTPRRKSSGNVVPSGT